MSIIAIMVIIYFIVQNVNAHLEETMQTLTKKHLTLFTLTTSLFWFSLYAYVAELSTYASHLGASYKLIGFITGSYGLTQLILRIPLGITSDLLGKRKIFILLGLMTAFISSLMTFFAPSPYSLLVTRLLAGVSAATWVTFTVLFTSYFQNNETTKAIGVINSYNAIGQLVAMALGGGISYFFGTRYLFLLAAIGAGIGFLVGLFIYETPGTRKKTSFKDFLLIAREPQLLTVSILAILSQLITFATAFGFVPILAKNMGAENIQLSFLTALAILPAVFVSRLAGNYLPKLIGRKHTVGIGFIISALLCILMPWIPSLSWLYVAQFVSGIGRSMVFALLMGLGIEKVALNMRATAMGFFQAIYGIGMVLGPVILGFIAESYGLTSGFAFTGFLGLIGVFITYRYIQQSHPGF